MKRRVASQSSQSAQVIPDVKKPVIAKPIIKTDLIGVDAILNKIVRLIKYGTKAIFIGGFHGLGKTTMVYELAKFDSAEVIRLQVTELLSEIDIVGGLDFKSGNFLYSDFVTKILEAIQNPDKRYYLLLDEFTRGREEALNILFPVLAEKTLFINSPYSEHKVIKLPENVKVFGTGNIKDKGLRDIGEAEFDRWNGVEVLPIKESSLLNDMIMKKTQLKDVSIISKLVNYYILSWRYGEEQRILPMSHRTMLEIAQITMSKMQEEEIEGISALKETINETYFISSQAVLNPNFRNTFETMAMETF
jgi:MoxR-like ATPase